MCSKSYFLGANTPIGFYSLFDELYNPNDNCSIFLIKGGPGTGKSSIMKKVASKAESFGFNVERIHCSSDPLSLDAVMIPEINTSIADATSPHVINPVYPGVCEHTIELSQCWNVNKLKNNTSEIKRITSENSSVHKKSVKYLKSAAAIDNEISEMILKITDLEKVKRFTERIIKTNKEQFTHGKKKKRFLSAVTPLGVAVQYDSILSENKNVIALNDKHSVISSIILKLLEKYIDENKISSTVCYCPMNPENKAEHIEVDNSFVIFTSNNYHPIITKATKTINTDRFINKNDYDKIKNKLAFLQKTKLELVGESVKCLEQAKLLHDVLESYYISAMDYFKVSQLTDELLKQIFN